MDCSCDAAGASTTELQRKEVNIWLREILGERHEVEMDDKGLTAMYKLMTFQKAAEKDALDQIVLLEEKTKTFNAKAEKLEAALSSVNIAPWQLPEKLCSQLEDLTSAAALLGCQDGCPQSVEDKIRSLYQQRKELKSKELELKTDIANFKELIQTIKARLASVKVGTRHMSTKDEECKMEIWEKNAYKRQARLARLEKKCRDRAPLHQYHTHLLSLSEELKRLDLKERRLDAKLQPMCDLPPDEEVIKSKLEAVLRTQDHLSKALEKKIEKERAESKSATVAAVVT